MQRNKLNQMQYLKMKRIILDQ